MGILREINMCQSRFIWNTAILTALCIICSYSPPNQQSCDCCVPSEVCTRTKSLPTPAIENSLSEWNLRTLAVSHFTKRLWRNMHDPKTVSLSRRLWPASQLPGALKLQVLWCSGSSKCSFVNGLSGPPLRNKGLIMQAHASMGSRILNFIVGGFGFICFYFHLVVIAVWFFVF